MADMTQSIKPENIEVLLLFLPVFEDRQFRPGEVVRRQGQLPYWDYDSRVVRFIRALYDNGWIVDFAWTEWQREAKRYWNDPGLIGEADLDVIQKLFTTLVRRDRFVDGHLAEAISNGHVVAILRRLKEFFTSDFYSLNKES